MAAVSIALALYFFGGVNSQTPVQVKSLVDTLLSNYDKRIRPVDDQTLPVILDVSFSLISIIGVDEVNKKTRDVRLPDHTVDRLPSHMGFGQ